MINVIIISIKINVFWLGITEEVKEEDSNDDRELEGEGDERNVMIVEVELIASNYGSTKVQRVSFNTFILYFFKI